MNITAIDSRIEQLEYDKSQRKQQVQILEKEIALIDGALRELWSWRKTTEAGRQYGEFRAEGEARVEIRLPAFGDRREIEASLQNPERMAGDYSPEEAAEYRAAKAREDAQAAAEILSARKP